MKRIIIVLALLMISISCLGQDSSHDDSTFVDTCFTVQQIHDISNTLDSLYVLTSAQDKAIISLQREISAKDNEARLDSLHIQFKNEEIQAKNKTIELYMELVDKSQPKWYNSKQIWFFGGVISTVAIGNLIVGTIR